MRHVRTALVALVMPLAAAASCGTGSDNRASGADSVRGRAVYVDGQSRQGRCSDARAVDEARRATTPWCTISHALQAAPDGHTVLVRRGRYPYASVTGRQRRRAVALRPFGDERVTLAGVHIEDSSDIRLQQFRIRGRISIKFGTRVQIVDNDISREGVSVRVGRSLLIQGNRIHDLTYEGVKAGSGYGIHLDGSWSDPSRQGIFDVVIRRNRFDRIPADGIQMGSVERVLIEGNRFTAITPFLDPTEHSDGIQMYGPGRNVTIRANVFRDTLRGLIAKGFEYPGLVIVNNVMVRLDGTALNIYDAPGARIVNNTIWDTPLGLRFRDLPEVPAEMRDAIVANNILQSFEFNRVNVAFEDHNLIGRRIAGQQYGPHDRFGSARLTRDYALRPDSRGIDAGTSRFAPDRDRRGRKRVDVSARPNVGDGRHPFVDLGAAEYKP